jgi:hypothetical protein
VQRDDDGGDEKDGRDFGTHRLFAPLAAFDRATRGRMQPGRIRAKAIRMPIVGPPSARLLHNPLCIVTPVTKISFTAVEAGHPHLDPGHWFFSEGQWAVCASRRQGRPGLGKVRARLLE